jgi:broad specificity phosphatase PhoE
MERTVILMIETAIFLRHGTFPGNLCADAVGTDAERVVEEGLGLRDYHDTDLTETGYREAEQARGSLSSFVIDACMSSTARRVCSTIGTVLRDQTAVCWIFDDNLYERDRGDLAYMPDEWAKQHPELWTDGQSVINRRPRNGEALHEAMDRLTLATTRADELYSGKTVLFGTHGDMQVAARAHPYFGRMSDERLMLPLVPNPGSLRGLQKAKWSDRVQADVYTRHNLYTGELSPEGPMTHFMSIGSRQQFRTPWFSIEKLVMIETPAYSELFK